MGDFGHGFVGRREAAFTSLLPLRANSYDAQALFKLSVSMKGDVDTVKDGPDPEENILVPAGYTYFGQFIDHDLTFDSTSSLDPSSPAKPTNLRTPKFDLDCVYGDGPDAQPFLYDPAGEKLLFRDQPVTAGEKDIAGRDLFRNPNGRAIIGDKRNDENSIVSQIQLSFIKYHNAVIEKLRPTDPAKLNVPFNLFASARNEVRWTYQSLVVHDFLRRIVRAEVLQGLDGKSADERAGNYALYTEDKRHNLPREFVAAAYRFGHSGVRTGYRMNAGPNNRFDIFPASTDDTKKAGAESLLGFDPVTNNQVIDSWERFFPTTLPLVLPTEDRSKAAGTKKDGSVRLQFAYKIDPTLVDPLGVLPRVPVAGEATTEQALKAIAPKELPDPVGHPPRPSLALLNLLRGNSYRIQGGQAIANALAAAGFPCTPLDAQSLVTRQPGAKDGTFKFVPIPAEFAHDTPLWFYVLAEAQAPIVASLPKNEPFDETLLLTGVGAKAQLGWVGGRIVSEVFYGLLDSDPDSFVQLAPPGWKPMLPPNAPLVFRSLLQFADSSNS
jgi:Animal haem peroxidase